MYRNTLRRYLLNTFNGTGGIVSIVSIDEVEGPGVWHYMQNPSRTENASFRAGQVVAKVTHHSNVNAFPDSDYCGQVWPTFVNHILTEPLDRTENKQTVSELPIGHLLRKPTHELYALTCEKLKDKTELADFDRWCGGIAVQFEWGKRQTTKRSITGCGYYATNDVNFKPTPKHLHRSKA